MVPFELLNVEMLIGSTVTNIKWKFNYSFVKAGLKCISMSSVSTLFHLSLRKYNLQCNIPAGVGVYPRSQR